MRTVKPHKYFKRDIERIKNSGIDLAREVDEVIAFLEADIPLPERFRDHALKGAWIPARECHIRADILLVYRKTPGELLLLRLASHSELFGK
jgi:mRNA interferase YafQ